MLLPARPSARWAPTDRRRIPVVTRRRSMLRDNAYSCRPIAPPTIDANVDSLSSATSATVSMPCARSLSAVTAPTPHNRRTGSGCRNASSRPGGTSSSPSGLASWLATFARNLVRAMPTVIGSPTRSRTSVRSRAAICTGVPDTRLNPLTSRNASSTEMASTSGEVSLENLEDRLAGPAVRRHPAAAPPRPAGTAVAPGRRPSRCARRMTWPRSWPRAPRRRRRSPGGRATRGRRVARRTHRTSRGPRAGWWPHGRKHARTYVRTYQ